MLVLQGARFFTQKGEELDIFYAAKDVIFFCLMSPAQFATVGTLQKASVFRSPASIWYWC
jgi:hypothetical protein